MRAHLEDFGNGWFGCSLELSLRELDAVIRALEALKSDPAGHFHFRSNANSETSGGLFDIEVSRMGSEESHDLVLDSSPPAWPGE